MADVIAQPQELGEKKGGVCSRACACACACVVAT